MELFVQLAIKVKSKTEALLYHTPHCKAKPESFMHGNLT